jgi:FkbM family methyltransferase
MPGHEILLPLSARNHYWSGPSEDARLFAFLSAALPPDGVYLDIGGNVGVYVAALARARSSPLRAVTFEPIATSAAILRETLALNGVEGARVEEVALSSAPGVLRLSNFPAGLNNFWVTDSARDVPQVEVPKMTLDGWMDANPGILPHAMKIDVEGHELEVLKGAQRTLRTYKPALVIECHCASWQELGVSRREFVELVASLGYRSAHGADGRPVDLLTFPTTIHLLLSDAPGAAA